VSNHLDQDEDLRLLKVAQAVHDAVEGGCTPTEALAKVAAAHELTPGRIRAVSAAYNTGRQLAQMRANKTAQDKFATFPLADAEQVVAERFAGETKTAAWTSDPDYQRPPTWLPSLRPAPMVKTAAAEAAPPPALPTDPELALRRAFHGADRAKQAAATARQEAANLEHQLHAKIHDLTRYFQKSAYDRLAFATVEHAVRVYMGKTAEALLDLVYGRGRLTEKRAGARLPMLGAPLNMDTAPFTLVRDCVRLGERTLAAQAAAKTAQARADAALQEAFAPFAPAPTSLAPSSGYGTLGNDDSLLSKRALFSGPAVGAAAGGMLARGLGAVPKPKSELIEDEILKLDDPGHLNELRKIRVNAMLQGMMTDPDDPVSGHDPDQVLNAYNEIAQLAPHLAEQPAALRPALARRLQGGVQPFETKELADTEKSIVQSRRPPVALSLGGEE
jgi:hypothetical protein